MHPVSDTLFSKHQEAAVTELYNYIRLLSVLQLKA